jgi:hypothetical protein
MATHKTDGNSPQKEDHHGGTESTEIRWIENKAKAGRGKDAHAPDQRSREAEER